MKKLLLIALFLIGASAWAQPKLAKQYGLTEVKQSYSVSGQSAKPTGIFTGKNGCLIYTGRNYYGWVFDSLTNDTIRYEMTFPKMKGAMRAAEPIPPVTEPLEVPQDLLDKAPQSMAPMRQAACAAITIKSPSTYFVMDFYSVQMLGGPQKAVDYITLRHAIRQQINQAGGDDVQRTIAGIYLMPNLQNKYDSLFQDPRYTGGSKANTALRWSAEQFINFGSQSSFITLYPLNFGGLAYRNPTWNRGGAAGIINGSQYAIADPWTYDFTNYCIPHEMDGHGAGNYHTFNCIEYTDPTGKPMKLDSSYNEGSCSSPIKCGDWGDILSYRHICSGGRIRAIWQALPFDAIA